MAIPSRPQLAFLGVSERAAIVREGLSPFLKWSFLGLKTDVLVPFFPTTLTGWNFVFAMRHPDRGQFTLGIKTDDGREVGWIKIDLEIVQGSVEPLTRSEVINVRGAAHAWLVFAFPIADPAIAIDQPGRHSIVLKGLDGSEEDVGQISFLLGAYVPLTPERIAAIRSDPQAAKAVRLILGCKKCPSTFRAYAALDRLPKQEAEGFVWYQEAPEEFVCECGATKTKPLGVRENLLSLVGHRMQADDDKLSFIPQYEASVLQDIRTEFIRLLNEDAPEETLQKFIERNPILLQQFAAEKLFSKPPILTFFNADFAILTPQKELVLIEIERAGTRLLKKDGGRAAPLNHAFDQVHSWLDVTRRHLGAVLESMKLSSDVVSKVRGVVIAGRDAGNDAAHLRRLKGIDYGDVILLTFDDLAAGLAALTKQMSAL